MKTNHPQLVEYLSGPAVRLVAVEIEGRVPFLDFLDALQQRQRSGVIDRLQAVTQAGIQWLEVNSRSVGPSVYELRSPRDVRVFWMRRGQTVVILLGGLKKNIGRRGQTRAIEASVQLAQKVKQVS
jgi:putative component of toxin-antitoxin plasmid stabilization module